MSTCVLCGITFTARHHYGLCASCISVDHLREYDRVDSAIRAARRQNIPASLTLSQWLAAVSDFEGKCAFCQEYLYGIIERVIPVHGLVYENVVPACRACSRRRGEGYDQAEIRVLHYLSQEKNDDDGGSR